MGKKDTKKVEVKKVIKKPVKVLTVKKAVKKFDAESAHNRLKARILKLEKLVESLQNLSTQDPLEDSLTVPAEA